MISPEGKPIQVNAGALQAAAAQNAVGMHLLSNDTIVILLEFIFP